MLGRSRPGTVGLLSPPNVLTTGTLFNEHIIVATDNKTECWLQNRAKNVRNLFG